MSRLQHIVLFSFPAALGAEDQAEMQRQVRGWPAQIEGIRSLRLGPPLDDARTRGFQYLLYVELDDGDALTAYRDHPVHQAFLAWLADRDCTSLAFDYYLDDATVVTGPVPPGSAVHQ